MDTFTERDYRCDQCHKLFFKGEIIAGELEIKCQRCGKLSNIYRSTDQLSPEYAQCEMVIDKSGQIIKASDTVAELLGYGEDRIVGKYLTDKRLHVSKKTLDQILKTEPNNDVFSFIVSATKLNGREALVSVTSKFGRDDTSQIALLVFKVSSVTKTKVVIL